MAQTTARRILDGLFNFVTKPATERPQGLC